MWCDGTIVLRAVSGSFAKSSFRKTAAPGVLDVGVGWMSPGRGYEWARPRCLADENSIRRSTLLLNS